MPDHPFAMQLRSQIDFFTRGTASLTEADSAFAPQPEMMSVAAHVAHVAGTVDWFVDGAFSPSGFDLNFAAHEAESRQVTSLTRARTLLAEAYARAIGKLEGLSLAELQKPIAPSPIMGGAPRLALVSGLGDHTAHHRGALAVYARLCGRVPAMPYA